jgi:outer membrane lipoprotein-sorting protein
MKHHRSLLVVILALTAALPHSMSAQANSPQLTVLLKQLDAASERFVNARADFRWDYYERVVHDTSTQNGSIYFERNGTSINMGAIVLNPNSASKSKIDKVIQYKAATLQMFDPGIDQITVLQAGANQAQYEGFLTLGFGGRGSDLDHAWHIKDLGPEKLSDDGQPVMTEKLDLTSRNTDGNSMFTHITIWVDPTRAISLKQEFYTASGDYRTAYYSHIKVNGNINKGAFAIKKDRNTTVVNH